MDALISHNPALQAMLAVLCLIRDCGFWTYRLLLVCNPYVCLLVTAGDTLSYNPTLQRKNREQRTSNTPSTSTLGAGEATLRAGAFRRKM